MLFINCLKTNLTPIQIEEEAEGRDVEEGKEVYQEESQILQIIELEIVMILLYTRNP